MVATAKIAVAAKDQHGMEWRSELIAPAHIGDGAREFSRRRIALQAKRCYSFDLIWVGRRWNPFGKHAHVRLVLQRVSRGCVAADDVVIEHPLQLPALALGQLRQVAAA